ncbi:MAG TPA: bifunctional hydroxymethylpyrimidine kinase/phosphomethylpyrimidine kinase [Mycobacterium sp.]
MTRTANTEPAFLPLTPPGQTPLRVLTIAGSDSGGGAGIQADMRTFAMLGLHACVAVTAVTVQNSVGVKGFHEIPVDVVAGQIAAVASDIGIQAAKTGMLASTDIIAAVVDTWRTDVLGPTAPPVPLVVDPVCASMHGDPLLHPSALDTIRTQLFPLATLVTPNLDEVRLLVDIEVVDTDTQREAARALHALGPQWALVKGGHLRSSQMSPDLLYDGTDFYEFDAPRVDTGNDHGAGDTLAAATAGALAHGYPVPDAVAFAKQWVTECIRAAYPLGHGHGPVSPLFRLNRLSDES